MTPSPLWKQIQSILKIDSDGLPGKITLRAVCTLPLFSSLAESSWESVQTALGIKADGIPGSQTAKALLQLLQSGEPLPVSFSTTSWPKESEVESFFGKPGQRLQTMSLPYPMRLAWDTGTTVHKITCHSLVSAPLERIFTKTLEHYGTTRISALGLDLFGGCYNDRNKVGGRTKSMHAYGIAVDLDPDRNQLKWNHARASFAKPEFEAFWSIVESEKAVSLGRARDYDWMHFQFARIK